MNIIHETQLYFNKFKIPLFSLVTFFFWFSLYIYVPILSTYADHLGASYKMIGLIAGSYGLSQMLLRIPLGIWSDTIQKRKIFIITGLVLSIISNLGIWYFPSVISLLIFRALSGAAAATWIIYTVLFTSYFNTKDTPKAIGIITAINYFGNMSAMLLGGIIAQKFGQEYTFLLASISGIIGLSLSFAIFEKKEIHSKPIKTFELLETATDTNLLLVSILAIFIQLITFATVYGFTPIVAQKMGANSFQLGMLTTLSMLPGIIAAATSGTFFTKKIGEKNTIIFGFIISSFMCISIPFIKDLKILYIAQIMGGFGSGLIFPLLMGLSIKNIQYHKRATAMGFFQAIYGLGMFLGPVMVGILSDLGNLNWGFWATGIFGIIGAIISAYYVKNNS